MAIRRVLGADLLEMRAMICQAAGVLTAADWVRQAVQSHGGE